MLLAFFSGFLVPEIGLACLPIAGFSAVVSVVHFLRHTRTEERQAEQRALLKEAYGDLDGWVVELTIFQGSTPTGRDRGALWFEDDWLYFVGERTSFALARRQVQKLVQEPWELSGLCQWLTLPLRIKTVAGRVSLGLELVALDEKEPILRTADRLVQALGRWRYRYSPAPKGTPPLQIGPEAPSVSRLFVEAVVVTLLWVAIGLLVLVPSILIAWYVALPIAGLAGLLLCAWSYVWTLRARWHSLRDRLKLERVEGR